MRYRPIASPGAGASMSMRSLSGAGPGHEGTNSVGPGVDSSRTHDRMLQRRTLAVPAGGSRWRGRAHLAGRERAAAAPPQPTKARRHAAVVRDPVGGGRGGGAAPGKRRGARTPARGSHQDQARKPDRQREEGTSTRSDMCDGRGADDRDHRCGLAPSPLRSPRQPGSPRVVRTDRHGLDAEFAGVTPATQTSGVVGRN